MADPEMTRHHAMDAVEQRFGRRVVRNDPARAQLEGAHDFGRVYARGYDDRSCRDGAGPQLPKRFHGLRSGRGHSEQEKVGGQLTDQTDRGRAIVAGLRHDLERRIRLEQPAKAFSEDRMSVGDENSYALCQMAKLVSRNIPAR